MNSTSKENNKNNIAKSNIMNIPINRATGRKTKQTDNETDTNDRQHRNITKGNNMRVVTRLGKIMIPRMQGGKTLVIMRIISAMMTKTNNNKNHCG